MITLREILILIILAAAITGFIGGWTAYQKQNPVQTKYVQNSETQVCEWTPNKLPATHVPVQHQFTSSGLNVDEVDLVTTFSNTGSMEPTLFGGNTGLFREFDGSKIEPGHIILFDHGLSNSPVVHRVIRVGDNTVTTRGDNNPPGSTETVAFDDIRYVLVGVLYN